MQSGHLEALERRIRSEPKRFRRSELAVDDHPEKIGAPRCSIAGAASYCCILCYIYIYIGAEIAAEQRGRHLRCDRC